MALRAHERRELAGWGLFVLLYGLVLSPLLHAVVTHGGLDWGLAGESLLRHTSSAQPSGHDESQPHEHPGDPDDGSAPAHTHRAGSLEHQTAARAPGQPLRLLGRRGVRHPRALHLPGAHAPLQPLRPDGDPRVTPLARATGYEVGVRTRLGSLDVGAAAWALDLDSELVWVGDDGTTEERGATRRRGLELDFTPGYPFTPQATGTLFF